MRTSHLAEADRPNLTLCGEPWEPWQDPVDKIEGVPDDYERKGPVRECQACLKVVRQARAYLDSLGPTEAPPERDLGTLATPKPQEVLAPDLAPRAGWHPTNVEPSSGQGGLPSAEPVGSVPAAPRSTAGPGVGGRSFEVGEWGWLCEDCAFFFTQDEATALKHSDERKHSLARCPKERAEARRRTHRKRRQRQRQRARQRSRISELESQLHRVLSVVAAALERAEVADDPSGAADEAAALLKQIVRLDGSYVPRDQ